MSNLSVATAALSSTEIYIVEGAGAAAIIVVLLMTLVFVLCYICRIRYSYIMYPLLHKKVLI